MKKKTKQKIEIGFLMFILLIIVIVDPFAIMISISVVSLGVIIINNGKNKCRKCSQFQKDGAFCILGHRVQDKMKKHKFCNFYLSERKFKEFRNDRKTRISRDDDKQ